MLCHFDSKSFNIKPSSSEIGSINNRICNTIENYSLNEFVSNLNSGKTIVPSIMKNNSRKQDNFKFTHFLFLDFDNSKKLDGNYVKSSNYLSIEDCLLKDFTKNNALLLYETFNSSKSINRFRLVFFLHTPIRSVDDFKLIYNKLLSIYPQADRACNDVSRMYFGAKADSVQIINPSAEFNISVLDNVIPVTFNESLIPDSISLKSLKNATSSSGNKITKYIENNKVNLLKKHIKNSGLSLKYRYSTEIELWEAFNKLDMFKLFNIPNGTFNCILFSESSPSCSVFKLPNGDYIYKRFSENNPLALNNFALFSFLFVGNYFELRDFVLEIFSIRILKINYIVRKFDAIFLKELVDTKTKKVFPKAYQLLFSNRKNIVKLLNALFKNPILVDNKYEFISFYGSRKLAEMIFGSEESKNEILELLDILLKCNIIKRVTPNDLSEIANKGFDSDFTFESYFENNQQAFKLSTINLNLSKIEKALKDFSPSAKNLNSDINSENKKITERTRKFISDVDKIITQNINSKEFLLDNQLKDILLENYSHKFIKTNYLSVVNTIIETKQLKRTCVNKDLITKFNLEMDCKSKTKMIYK